MGETLRERLLPCPFCGGEAQIDGGVGAECSRCLAVGPGIHDGDTVAAWNRRALSAERTPDGWIVEHEFPTKYGVELRRWPYDGHGWMSKRVADGEAAALRQDGYTVRVLPVYIGAAPTATRQQVAFTLADVWDAFETGAKEARANGGNPSDALISQSADAYCKLTYDAHGGDIAAPTATQEADHE